MESSVTIPLAYYEELKERYDLFKYDSKSIIMTSKYGCQYMNVLSESQTIRVLETEMVYLKESLNDNIELNRILNEKLEEKRSPFGFLNNIYLYFKK
jgi:hypothetical protein